MTSDVIAVHVIADVIAVHVIAVHVIAVHVIADVIAVHVIADVIAVHVIADVIAVHVIAVHVIADVIAVHVIADVIAVHVIAVHVIADVIAIHVTVTPRMGVRLLWHHPPLPRKNICVRLFFFMRGLFFYMGSFSRNGGHFSFYVFFFTMCGLFSFYEAIFPCSYIFLMGGGGPFWSLPILLPLQKILRTPLVTHL